MIFREPMLSRVLDGSKTVTRRPATAPYEAGKDYAVQPGRGKHGIAGKRVEVLDTRFEPLSAMTEADARLEGFEDRDAFLDYWRQLYGQDFEPDQVVKRIEFRLVETDA